MNGIVFLCCLLLSACAFYQKAYEFREQHGPARSTSSVVSTDSDLVGPVRLDAYGPGLHSDGTGRPFSYRTRDGRLAVGTVVPDGYGPGVHKDQSGQPVYAVPE